jgi:hypothetical protein
MKHSASNQNGGMSKKSIIHISHPGWRELIILTSGKQNERKAEAQKKRRSAIQRNMLFLIALHLYSGCFFRTK